MNKKEFESYIDLFKKCHPSGFVIVKKSDFLARHCYEVEYQSKGCAIVYENDQVTPAFICYFNESLHPSEFEKDVGVFYSSI